MNNRQKLVQKQFLNNEEEIIKRLNSIYDQSLKDVNDKIKRLDFSIGKLQQEYDWLDDKDPQKAQVKSRIQSKIYQKQYQQQLQKQLDGILSQLQTKSYLAVSDYLDKCYSDGFIGTIFDLHGQGIPLVMPIDQRSMVRAVQLDSKISKGLYTMFGEDISVLKKRITSQVTRGISTGMSFQQVAQQLAGETRIGYNNAVRIARTEGHRIQCQAGMDACRNAKDKGADVVKQWDAALDGRTRESHALVDGEIRELDKPFSNGLDFPGDPSGGASEVINCRCALLQRARWALNDDELETLKERAKYYGLDKANEFEDFKKKYLKAVDDSVDIFEKAKTQVGLQRLSDKDKMKLITEIRARNPHFEFQHNGTLANEIAVQLERNDPPTLLDKAAFDKYVADNDCVKMWRGVQDYFDDDDELIMSVKAIEKEFMYGNTKVATYGGGNFGSGYHFSTDEKYARGFGKSTEDQDGTTFVCALKPTAKVVSHSKAVAEADKLGIEPEEWALLSGYDALKSEGRVYNILNRRALVMRKP